MTMTLGQVEQIVSTHSRLKAAGEGLHLEADNETIVSTPRRLKAAGPRGCRGRAQNPVSTHSRLKAAGGLRKNWIKHCAMFQHTAA